jgi:hypothetical protein
MRTYTKSSWGSWLPTTIFLLSVLALPAKAQQSSRDGNVWNGREHQPTQERVQHREQAAGIAPSTQQRTATDAELDQLSRQLGAGPVNPPTMGHRTPSGQTPD